MLADYRNASAEFPFYALVPQAAFLPWLAERARPYGLDVRMGARVSDAAARRRGPGHRRRATAARRAATGSTPTSWSAATGATPRCGSCRRSTATELSSSIDICWIALPRRDDDPRAVRAGADHRARPQPGRARPGRRLADRVHHRRRHVRRAAGRGAEPLRELLRRRLPWLGDRIELLADVNQLTLLPIRITSTDRWSEPGLLLIGDAAHVISPVGGNGINFAIIDAAEAANRLVGPLTADPVDPAAIDAATAEVERARRPRVDRDQRMQVRVERATAQRLATGSDPAPGAAAADPGRGARGGPLVGPPRRPRAGRTRAWTRILHPARARTPVRRTTVTRTGPVAAGWRRTTCAATARRCPAWWTSSPGATGCPPTTCTGWPWS